MKKVSVIVPVYNTEKYLNKCLNSIVNQKRLNDIFELEVIIVNDGSTDNSQEIIQKYEDNFSFVRSYFQRNSGLSVARNIGISKATGDYLCFVDSDDYISTELFKNLTKYMNSGIEMVKFTSVSVDEKYNQIKKHDFPAFQKTTGENAFNLLYGTDDMIQPAWGYVYKKEFWDKNGFEFPKEKYHEDFARTILILLKAKSVVGIDVVRYYYYQSNNSIMRNTQETKQMQKAMDLLEHYDYMIMQLPKYSIEKKTKQNVKIFYTNCIVLYVNELSGENQRKYIKEIQKRKMYTNIKVRNLKQLVKKILLHINVKIYLKLR